MAQYMMILKFEDDFYREFSEQGAAKDTLLKQLEFDIEDQLDEYDLPQLLTHLVSSTHQDNLVVFAPKKSREEEQTPQLLLVGNY